nr:hypothetical protein Cplu_424 [Cedratvirus plubellavi]
MLSDTIFSIFEDERYKYQRDLLEQPEKEITLASDLGCRNLTYKHLLDKSYKCLHCARIDKIARVLPDFTVESGDNKGKNYTIVQKNIRADFAILPNNVIYYDNFRGSIFIGTLLSALGLNTIDTPLCAYSCQSNCTLECNYDPITCFDLNLLKQLVTTLSLLQCYKFVFDDLRFEQNTEKVSFLYEGVKVSSCNTSLKIKGWSNSSLSFNQHRLVAGSNLRKLLLCEKSSSCDKEVESLWFKAKPFSFDLKHLGDTRYNIYTALIKLRPLMDSDVVALWKELWKEEEYDTVEQSIRTNEFNWDHYHLRSDALELLIERLR